MRLDSCIVKPLSLGLGLGVALSGGTLIPIQRLGLAPLAALVRAEQLGERVLSVGEAMLARAPEPIPCLGSVLPDAFAAMVGEP